jgi:hydrogenase nickel incorporation protein HypA/HybF
LHELGITENILRIALEVAERAEAQRIRRIHLVIGELSSVGEESVKFYFGFVGKNTIAEGAELVFEKKPVQLRCRACHREFQPLSGQWTCPVCQAPGPEIVSGHEFYMDSIEVD